MKPFIEATFQPRPDITVLELAEIVSRAPHPIKLIRFEKDQWDTLDESIERHFSRVLANAEW